MSIVGIVAPTATVQGASASAVTICSNALSLLGESPILSLLDSTQRARQCNNHYAIARDATLMAHPWNFAKLSRTLVQGSTAPTIKYSAAFTLPSDYLRMVEVLPRLTDYEVMGADLQTNENAIDIIYIQRVTDVSRYSPMFVEALEHKIASLIAPVLKSDHKIADRMQALFRDIITRAKIVDGQEEATVAIEADDLIDARLRLGSTGPKAVTDGFPL